MNDHEKLKYPIGKYDPPESIDKNLILQWIGEIDKLPGQLENAVSTLSEKQLNTPYRRGGWTIRQVVHHIGDSHVNSYIRFKLALTEKQPVIKPYDEALWAELPDNDLFSISDSLSFIKLLHNRWVLLLRSLKRDQLIREFIHPDSGVITLKYNIGLYAWHGKHHLAHITSLVERSGW